MKVRFHCNNDECCTREKEPYIYEIEHEAWMDEQNIATVYCPHCNCTMEQISTPDSGD